MRPPHQCPACRGRLEVSTLACSDCGTRIEGKFRLCPYCRLEPQEQELLDLFLRSRGNVKELQRELGVSYPTARSRLEQLYQALGYRSDRGESESAADILMDLRTGEIDVDEAAHRLKNRGTA